MHLLLSMAAAQSLSMPTPEGWKTETIPFPLEFAPSISPTGTEQLRFAPGMFDVQAEGFWTYAFVWQIPTSHDTRPKALATDLNAYFDGLATAVASDKGKQPNASAKVSLSGSASRLSGKARVFDAFTTMDMVRLNIEGQAWTCPGGTTLVVLAWSPQPAEHALWDDLRNVVRKTRCSSPTPPEGLPTDISAALDAFAQVPGVTNLPKPRDAQDKALMTSLKAKSSAFKRASDALMDAPDGPRRLEAQAWLHDTMAEALVDLPVPTYLTAEQRRVYQDAIDERIGQQRRLADLARAADRLP